MAPTRFYIRANTLILGHWDNTSFIVELTARFGLAALALLHYKQKAIHFSVDVGYLNYLAKA